MEKKLIGKAAFILMVAVGLGAFGAHGLKDLISVEHIDTWQTGVTYQFYHGLALLILASFTRFFTPKTLSVISTLFIVGILLFSGSLYVISLIELIDNQSIVKVLGPLTPLGGLCFIVGWILLLLRSMKG